MPRSSGYRRWSARAVLAHLIKLVTDGKVACDGQPSVTARFRLRA